MSWQRYGLDYTSLMQDNGEEMIAFKLRRRQIFLYIITITLIILLILLRF